MTTRRSVLRFIGAGSAALLSARVRIAAAQNDKPAACVVRPRHVEGPFFVERALMRSDIRSDPKTGAVKDGVPLRLAFRVSQMNARTCLPLPGARVDVWHCDAEGLYSEAKEWQTPTVGQRFLRGYQLTDRRGYAAFTTIFPGWYPNRTVHIHFKIRPEAGSANDMEFTSQIFFDDALTDAIHAQPPYLRRGVRKVRNDRDLLYLFRGNRLVLPLREDRRGYAGTFDIALEIG